MMAGLLREHFGSDIEFDLPDGGLAVWVRFKDGIDVDEFARLARAQGVQLLPGSAFATTSAHVPGARLGFASLDPAELRNATHRLRVAFGKLQAS